MSNALQSRFAYKTAFILVLLTLGLLTTAAAQDETPTAVTTQNRTGDLPFSTSIGTDVEHVDVTSGDLTIDIPIAHVPGRGMAYDFRLRYDPRALVVATRSAGGPSNQLWTIQRSNFLPTADTGFGWGTNQPQLTFTTSTLACPFGSVGGSTTRKTNYIYRDPTGAKRPIALQLESSSCNSQQYFANNLQGPDLSGDGTWGKMNAQLKPTILSPGGFLEPFGTSSSDTFGNGLNTFLQATDNNGNTASFVAGGLDTLGKPVVTQTNGTNQITYAIKDSNGVSRSYVVNFTSLNINTHFNATGSLCSPTCNTVQELNQNRQVISSILLPNGRSYQFQYDGYGGITQLTLPTGAMIQYAWTTLSLGVQTFRYVSSRTVTVDGHSSTWTFNVINFPDNPRFLTEGPLLSTVTDPAGNQSTYESSGGSLEIVKIFQGTATGTPIRQYVLEYTSFNDQRPQLLDMTPTGFLPTRLTTTLDNGLVSKKEFDYDTFTYTYTYCVSMSQCLSSGNPNTTTLRASRGNVREIREYDYGSGAPGVLLRRTTKTYLHDSNSTYVTKNIVNRVLVETILDGASTQKSQTQYEYDNYSGTNSIISTSATPAPQHDYTNFGTGFATRGNATGVSKWRNTDGALLKSTYRYDDLGNIRTITDPLAHSTSWTYSDAWSDSSCSPGTNSQAYPNQRTDALGHRLQFTYFTCTGLRKNKKDENDIAAARPGATSLYDLLGRVKETDSADGGQVLTTYIDTPPASISTVTKLSGAQNIAANTILDGLGRTKQTQLTSDPISTVFTDTTYDDLGRKVTQSNPYRTTSDSTYGVTSYQYDALGRTTLVTPPGATPSSGSSSFVYSGNVTTITDESGKGRTAQTDALGRLTVVHEDPAGLNFETDYQYNTLDLLTGVTQGALLPRTFVYNSLSQLTSATNPESGVTSYMYDLAGNLQAKTDARNVTTTYSYDAVNRLTQKSYSDTSPVYANGTPTVTFTYDQPNGNVGGTPITIANGVGHLSWETTLDQAGNPSSKSAFSYDPMGRVAQIWACQNVSCSSPVLSVTYSYDLAGHEIDRNVGSVDYASTYNTAGQLISFTQTNFTVTNWLSNMLYDPMGHISATTYGNGLSQLWAYDARGRFASSLAGTSCTGGTCTNQKYSLGLSYAANGNVNSANDSVNGNWTFGYDGLNRLASSSCSATCPNGTSTQGYSYSFDRFGNRTQQTVTAGTGFNVVLTFSNNNNRIDGSTYDLAGNLLNDGTHAYAYDAENRIKSVDNGATTYFYDAEGRRFERIVNGVRNDYFYGRDGASLIDIQQGLPLYQEIYAGGLHLATQLLNSAHNGTDSFYHFNDWLGSERERTDANGNIVERIASLPFGDGQAINGGVDVSVRHFTGKERDTETAGLSGLDGLDYFGARYYASKLGRWMSPDWAATPTAVPYADFGNPQSLNLYAYVSNNPVTRADLDGHGEWYSPAGKKLGTDGVQDGSVHVAQSVVKVNGIVDASSTNDMFYVSARIGGAIQDSVTRTLGRTKDDTKGGFHEEGFTLDSKGINVAAPGPAYKPGDDEAHIDLTITSSTSIVEHTHPAGTQDPGVVIGGTHFNQEPSTMHNGKPGDLQKVNNDNSVAPGAVHIEVGAGDSIVRFYDQKGTQARIPLSAFPQCDGNKNDCH